MLEAIDALVSAVEAGHRVPEVIGFVRSYPGVSTAVALVFLAGLLVAILIRRITAEKSLSIR
jgi:hypothetical protein